MAAKRGFVDVVSLLLEFHARVDLTGSDGVTAFAHAAANGHVDILRLLYGKGAKVLEEMLLLFVVVLVVVVGVKGES